MEVVGGSAAIAASPRLNKNPAVIALLVMESLLSLRPLGKLPVRDIAKPVIQVKGFTNARPVIPVLIEITQPGFSIRCRRTPMKNNILFSLIAICLAAARVVMGSERGGGAAGGGQPAAREDGLDPTPIGPSDPNVGMFINDWKNSKPRRAMYGKLAFRDILTKLEGPDPQHPAKRGAVLTAITAISYATLAPGRDRYRAARSRRRTAGILCAPAESSGQITVNSKSWDVKDGIGFTLTPVSTSK